MARTSYKSIYSMTEWELLDERKEVNRLKNLSIASRDSLRQTLKDKEKGAKKYKNILSRFDDFNPTKELNTIIESCEGKLQLFRKSTSELKMLSHKYKYAQDFIDKGNDFEKELVKYLAQFIQMKDNMDKAKENAKEKHDGYNNDITALKNNIESKKAEIRGYNSEINNINYLLW